MQSWARIAALVAVAGAQTLAGCGAGGSSPGSGDPPGMTRLARGAHPLARADLDQGPLDPGRRIENLSLVFKASAAQAADLEALRAAQLDPSSPSYHRWLTPEQYEARFGARGEDVDRARSWLSGQGLEVTSVSRLGTRLTFSGRVADVERAFRSEMRRYRVGPDLHYAMATAPAVPADLADVVLAVHNTHDFYPRPMMRRARRPDYNAPGIGQGLGPPDWAAAYDVTPLYTNGIIGTPIDGSGTTIAVVGVAEIAPADIDAFRSTFGLPATHLTTTLVPNTGPAAGGQQGDGAEAILDVEWSGGVAKGATINYVFTGASDGNVDDATYYAIEQNLAPVLSESWGGCEQGLAPADADVIAVYGSAANVMGITYLAAAGDTGGAECIQQNVAGLYGDVPATYPGVTGVGGTQFPTLPYDSSGNVTGYSTSETTWNEGFGMFGAAGGGGISIVFARPSYQSGLPTCATVGTLPTSVTPSNMRQYPDISATAAGNTNPILIDCTTDPGTGDCSATGGSAQLSPISGTSASTPAIAGVVALVVQATGGRLGNINPLLYTLASTTPDAFHDITTGDNEQQCSPGTDVGCPAGGRYGFPAATGYDCATGLGTLDVTKLVTAWAALAPTTTALAAMPTMTTEGTLLTLTATVAVPAPNSSALGGNVVFAFESYNATGGPDLSWTLGTQAIAGGTIDGGTATYSGTIPPGLVNPSAQYVDAIAMYSGDASHLASTSAKVRIAFGPIVFTVTPATATVSAGGHLAFKATGGVPPARWYTGSDTTCDMNGNCSTIDASTGAFVGGPVAGSVIVFAVDSQGAEAQADVTVVAGEAGAPDAGPADGGAVDSGKGDAAVPRDAGAADTGAVAVDAASPRDAAVDAGEPKTATGGCACTTTGRSSHPDGPAGALGLALGAVACLRARRRPRVT